MAYPYEYFNCIDYKYEKPVNLLKKVDFFCKLKTECPSDVYIDRTKEINEFFDNKNGEQLTELYCKSDVILKADIFEKFIERSFKDIDINPLYCVSLSGYTWQCGMKYFDIELQALQSKDMILLLENNLEGRIGSVIGDRCVVSDENKKIFYIDGNIFYGWAMSQSLPYDGKKVKHVLVQRKY